jgi:hypothetical protein
MRDKITEVLEYLGYKGNFVSVLKNKDLWQEVSSNTLEVSEVVSEVEKVYLYLYPETILYCGGGNIKRYLGLRRGYSEYCRVTTCNECKNARIESNKQGVMKKYGVDNIGKLPEAIAARKKFWNDKDAVNKTKEKRIQTNQEVYGCDNPAQSTFIKDRMKNTFMVNYGVDNPSKDQGIKDKKKATTMKNYGVDYPTRSDVIKEKTKKTNLEKYGVMYPMQVDEIKNRMMETKVKNGSFSKSNSSTEATEYFRKYTRDKGYDMGQVAYADPNIGLHEWGFYFDRWYLYDFVAFEKGCRGDHNKIIEIVEYQGPFHYTEHDLERKDAKAYPWKSNSTTIEQSIEKDKTKKELAEKFLTENYTVVWSEKYHK